MSKYVPATIRCRCGAELHVQVAESINGPRGRGARERILDGTFHVFTCEGCGHENPVEKQFIYLDFSAKQWLSVFPEPHVLQRDIYAKLDDTSFHQTMVERSPEIVKAWAPQFTRRLVCGLAGLREKLVVFDAGLDDRLIELMKLDVVRKNGLSLVPNTRFSLVEATRETLQFLYAATPDEGAVEVEVPIGEYARMVSTFDRYQPAIDELFGESFVDYRCALG